MQARLTLFAVMSAALVAIGCHSATVHITSQCNGTLPCIANAKPDPLVVTQSSGTFTVKWRPAEHPQPWLVQFPDTTPCKAGTLVQSGRTESCVIDTCQMDRKYKYFAFFGAARSNDPSIEHDTKRVVPGCRPTPGKPTPGPTRQPTLFCLDLTSGSPVSCKSGDPPQGSASPNPLQNVSVGDDVYWQPDSGWTITMDAGACDQGTSISSKQAYCTISKNAGKCSVPGSFCTYNYTVTRNGANTGPFQIQVTKP